MKTPTTAALAAQILMTAAAAFAAEWRVTAPCGSGRLL